MAARTQAQLAIRTKKFVFPRRPQRERKALYHGIIKKNRMGKNRKRFEGTPKTMERPLTDEADRKEVEASPRSKRTFRKAVILALNYTCNLQSGGSGAAAAYQF